LVRGKPAWTRSVTPRPLEMFGCRGRRGTAACDLRSRLPLHRRTRHQTVPTPVGEGQQGSEWLAQAKLIRLLERRGNRSQSPRVPARGIRLQDGQAECPLCRTLPRSPLTDSNRRPPPYHILVHATNGNRWQRFWLVWAVFRPDRFATGCHWLPPLCSINAPSSAAGSVMRSGVGGSCARDVESSVCPAERGSIGWVARLDERLRI